MHLTAERHFKTNEKRKHRWPVSQLVREVAEELQVFCDRTEFASFPGIVPSMGVLTVDTGSSASMLLGDLFTSATNTPVVCNSVVVNRAVNASQ